MNEKATGFLKNLAHTVVSNLISLVVSTLVVLVVPKLLGVEEYGYWQLYLFYSAYVGFLHLGWNDGIYLRYGGKRYEELDKDGFHTQLTMLAVSQILIAGIIFAVLAIGGQDPQKLFIFAMVLLTAIVLNVRYFFLFVLQATSRIRPYAAVTIYDRVVYLALVVGILLLGNRDYRMLVFADVVGKSFGLFMAALACRDMLFARLISVKEAWREAVENIRAGSKLMFATIAGMLIIGIVRFGIERVWDVSTFGKVSLTLSISNMMMLFINAVGIILFPILRRSNPEKLPGLYKTLRNVLSPALLAILLFYYPLRLILSYWLPQYADSLRYMALVFPMFIYEGTMALLIGTYMKTLREEKAMMTLNMGSMILSALLTLVATLGAKNLEFAVVNIVFLLAFRAIATEWYLGKKLGISIIGELAGETILIAVFMVSGWYANSWWGVLGYAAAYLIFWFIRKKEWTTALQELRSKLKS